MEQSDFYINENGPEPAEENDDGTGRFQAQKVTIRTEFDEQKLTMNQMKLLKNMYLI